jgi:hypothetical protein
MRAGAGAGAGAGAVPRARSAPAMTWPGWAVRSGHQFSFLHGMYSTVLVLVAQQIPTFQQQFIVGTASHLSSVSSYMIVEEREKREEIKLLF